MALVKNCTFWLNENNCILKNVESLFGNDRPNLSILKQSLKYGASITQYCDYATYSLAQGWPLDSHHSKELLFSKATRPDFRPTQPLIQQVSHGSFSRVKQV